MTSILTSLINRSTSETGELQFSQRSPTQYSSMLLEQAGITDLRTLNRVFIGDPGFDVAVRERALGMGMEFGEKGAVVDPGHKAGWLVFERLPADDGDKLRARIFRTFEGAAAEFAIKLRLHHEGDVRLVQIEGHPGAHRLSFNGTGRLMVMAPFDAGLEAVSTTR